MVIKLTVGTFGTNTYIYFDENSRQGVVIDPAAEAERILAKISELALEIQAILLTHGHFDHTSGVNEVRAALNVPVYAAQHEAALISDPAQNGADYFGIKVANVEVDKLLSQEGEAKFGGLKIHVLATPGHTRGCICFYIPETKALFAGDTLFKESYGRYDLPTGDFPALTGSLNRLLMLPEDVVVYPGHGPSTTIGHEKTHNLIRR